MLNYHQIIFFVVFKYVLYSYIQINSFANEKNNDTAFVKDVYSETKILMEKLAQKKALHRCHSSMLSIKYLMVEVRINCRFYCPIKDTKREFAWANKRK